ncbi:MAG: hypothetical protein JRG96_00125 [Deltaproteobacteria bacterium]|nr:hypothetical protein [Deltaproteobacteria bacterium]
MRNPVLRTALWLLCAVVLLLGGLLLVLYGFWTGGHALGAMGDASTRQSQLALVTYYRVVALKGLLPQLLLVLALWPVACRLLPFAESSRRGLAGALAIVASLAFALVAPALLTSELAGLPALRMRGPRDAVFSFLLMTAAVTLAALVPRLLIPALRPAAPARLDGQLLEAE